MIANLEIFTGSDTADSAGVFISVADIAGLQTSELIGEQNQIEGYLVYGLLNSLYLAISTLAPLGFPDVEKSDPTGTGTGKYSEGCTFRIQRLLDLRTGTANLPGLATMGTSAGQKGLALNQIWANAAKVTVGDAVTAGILIPNAWIEQYGAEIPASVSVDARAWVAALIVAMNHAIAVRTATVASAIIRKTNPDAIRPTGAAIPAEYYDATNPTTALTSADLPFVRLIVETLTIEYEIVTDAVAQTLEINVATL